MKLIISISTIAIFTLISGSIIPNTQEVYSFDSKLNKNEETKDYWHQKGKKFVQDQIDRKPNKKVAKNIIFFLGDGMSLATLAATRVFKGGEEQTLSFENFPYTGLAKTYAVDKIVPDSASTTTAYLTGVKANYATIGINAAVKRTDCIGTLNKSKYTTSIGQWAINAGKSIGFATTTRVTHASPAGLYAHTADRDWENDAEVKKDCGASSLIPDIAHQLIHGDVGPNLTVILGGGRQEFRQTDGDMEQNAKGLRTDGRDLIEEWIMVGSQLREKREYVYKKDDLMKIDPSKVDKLLGIFNDDHMPYNLEADKEKMPTLAEMTQKAVEMLQSKSKEGYFLFVEGGRIDTGHHGTYAHLAFDETLEFAKAIEWAKQNTNEEETLIVVSSDHSHTMSISGYPKRHNDIFDDASTSKWDNLPYLTINYANGKGLQKYINLEKNARLNPLDVDRHSVRSVFPATVEKDSETHGGEDVGVFASGPWAHLFTGVYEQNVLPHLLAYSSCIGPGHKACDKN